MKKLAKRVLLFAALTSSLPLKAFPSGVAKTLLTSLVLFGTQMGRAGKPVHFVKSTSGVDRIGYDLLVQTDANGNDRFVVTGSYEDDKTFVSTFNMTGDVESTILLDGKNVRSIAATKDGGYLLAGQRVDNDNAQVIKLDKNFDVEWTSDLKDYTLVRQGLGTIIVSASYQPYAVQEYSDGEAFAVVGVKEEEEGYLRLFLWKIATGGEPIRLIEFDDTTSSIGSDLLVKTNGQIFIVGTYGPGTSTYGAGSCLLAQLSFETEDCIEDDIKCLLWSHVGLNHNDRGVTEGLLVGYSMVESSEGLYVVTGMDTKYNSDRGKLFVSIYSASGTLEFTNKLLVSSKDDKLYASEGRAVIEDNDGNFIITGFYEDKESGIRSLLLLKVSRKAALIWAKTYHEGDYNIGYSIGLANRDKIVVTGVMADDDTATPYLLLMQWSNDGKGCGIFQNIFYMEPVSVQAGILSPVTTSNERLIPPITESPLPSSSTLDEEPLNVTCTVTTLSDPAVRASHHSLWVFPLALISSLLIGRWG